MSHDTMGWEQRLARAGYRVTRQRTTILDAVCAGGGHTTLSEIQGRVAIADPGIDRSTIYRALQTFTTAGIVVVADTGDPEPYYEIVHPEPHHHLRCQQCGGEREIAAADLAGLSDRLLARYGFTLESDHLVLFGRCAACQSGQVRADSPG